VDLYFIHKEALPLEELIPQARRKYIGLEPYWLAVSFQKVDEVDVLPRLLKPVTLEQLKEFFRGQAA
jgi:hypothetical protein